MFWDDVVGIITGLPAWLQTKDGQNAFFTWIIFGAAAGGVGVIVKKIYNIVRTSITRRRTYVDAFGEFFLYHLPLIEGLNDLPRIAKLKIYRGLDVPAKARQSDANNRGFVLYEGEVERLNTVFLFKMKSLHGECDKSIILWHFQRHAPGKERFTVGVMSSLNFKAEPYRVSIIVSEKALPRSTVDQVLHLLVKTTIDRDLRRKAFELFKASPDAKEDEEFEHMGSPPAPITKQDSFWRRISRK